MGSPFQSQFPEARDQAEPSAREYVYVLPTSRPPERLWRYVALFCLTVVTTTLVGIEHYASFYAGLKPIDLPFSAWQLAARGLWYSASILAILGAHEFGHYYACRYYGVDASLPYFLPVPLPLTGTLGAFIRIRHQIPTKRALFDIGIAGPIAGFLVLIPVLMFGMFMSRVVEIPDNLTGTVTYFGEPLLLKAIKWLTFGTLPPNHDIILHPVGFAAWFGMLATTLNLFPVGQTDGGHISYAVFGRRSTFVSFATLACLVGLSFLAYSWIVWTGLMALMLVVIGPHHPRTVDDHVPLDRPRAWLAGFALVMFVVCFT